ncbi:SCP-like extracellular protein [Phytophthora infestans T30-4]|uniref:SCP-like extracellular protein n=1 Tax=Phytophthora infestans (strain T30-4) TaxID=403677 RepID=D0NE54_PHYIT|nr:SCP-like extracellular protein [Phytophthora infestans T30-4]EEY56499.1 SCP-like extracellular protein [Phytophthora infestans T30-4]|eukprot:XP_002902573.1 SCP-like extracellular protein [Phytophthora infestans T30-4]
MPRFSTFAIIAASVVAVSVVPSTTAFQLGSGGRVMWENNCNFSGNDYRWMKAIPVCGDVCAGDSKCTHWTWSNSNGGTCWFKTGPRSAKTTKWGTNCGYVVSRNSVVQVQAQGTALIQAQVGSSSGLSPVEMSEMLSRINSYRAQNGLGALTIDNRLVIAATLHSKDQASHCTMTHSGSNGSNLGDRVKAQSYSFAMVAENVAAGQNTVESVMTAWWNSPGHRANLLSKDAQNVGFAKVVNNNCDSYAAYWTQDFGRLG